MFLTNRRFRWEKVRKSKKKNKIKINMRNHHKNQAFEQPRSQGLSWEGKKRDPGDEIGSWTRFENEAGQVYRNLNVIHHSF